MTTNLVLSKSYMKFELPTFERQMINIYMQAYYQYKLYGYCGCHFSLIMQFW